MKILKWLPAALGLTVAALVASGRNLDALYDFLTEYGPGMKIVFVHAAAAPAAFKRVCADAMEETPGLEIVFA